jgi:hypothetical protein
VNREAKRFPRWQHLWWLGIQSLRWLSAELSVWYKLTGGGLREMKTPSDIGTVTQDLLDGSRYNPLFKNGWGTFNGNNPSEIYVNADASLFTGPSWILGLYQPNQGSTVASDPVKRNQLLAEMIPAL